MGLIPAKAANIKPGCWFTRKLTYTVTLPEKATPLIMQYLRCTSTIPTKYII